MLQRWAGNTFKNACPPKQSVSEWSSLPFQIAVSPSFSSRLSLIPFQFCFQHSPLIPFIPYLLLFYGYSNPPSRPSPVTLLLMSCDRPLISSMPLMLSSVCSLFECLLSDRMSQGRHISQQISITGIIFHTTVLDPLTIQLSCGVWNCRAGKVQRFILTSFVLASCSFSCSSQLCEMFSFLHPWCRGAVRVNLLM